MTRRFAGLITSQVGSLIVLFAMLNPSWASPPTKNTSAAEGTGESEDFSGYCKTVSKQVDSTEIERSYREKTSLIDELKARSAEIDKKVEILQRWLEMRNEFEARATDGVVKIYSAMQPEVAAAQLAAMSEDAAAAVLLKLEPKRAGAMLGEMEPTKAARLATYLAVAGGLKLGAVTGAESSKKATKP